MKYDQIKVLVQDNDITGVKLLLESLADDSDLIVNMTSSSQPKTLLYYASEMNYIEIVHLLVEAGADGSGTFLAII